MTQFAESEICQITQTTWSVVLGQDAERGAWKEGANDRFLTGCVSITGAWEGALTLDCSAALMKNAAATMLQVDADKVRPEDIQDALAELTNIVGGNVKRLLPGPSKLTLPAVAEGAEFRLKVPGSQVLSEIAFECQGEPLRVTLLQRDEKPRPVGKR